MGLAVYNSRLYLDNNTPWVDVVLADLVDNSFHKVVIIAEKYVGLENTTDLPSSYNMIDQLTGVEWELFVVEDRLGMVPADSANLNICGSDGQGTFKVGGEIKIRILNINSNQEEEKIKLSLVDLNGMVLKELPFTDVVEISNGFYESSIRIFTAGEYLLISELPGEGVHVNRITILERTMIDLNMRLESLSEVLTNISSFGFI